MRDFKKLLIWQKGMDIVDKAYDLIAMLPQEEKYGMKSQISRCATSIPGNIAEGSAKSSEKDYKRYLEISLGSVFELETHLLVAKRRKWADDNVIDELLGMITEGQKMLQSFIKKLE